MVHLSKTLSFLSAFSGTAQTRHIFIASSAGQIVNTIVPSGLRQLCPTGPVCAATLTTRRKLGYECTVSEFVSAVFTDTGRSRSRWRLRPLGAAAPPSPPGRAFGAGADEEEDVPGLGRYHVSVGLNLWAPRSYVTCVRRGLTDYGPLVAQIE